MDSARCGNRVGTMRAGRRGGSQPVKEGRQMNKRVMTMVGAGGVAVAIAFHGAAVLAKGPKECKAQFGSAPHGGKATRQALNHKSGKKGCQKGLAPTP